MEVFNSSINIRYSVKLFRHIIIFSIILSSCSILLAQDTTSTHKQDTTIIFGTIPNPEPQQRQADSFANSCGVDVLVSTNGFGLGTFYKHKYTDDLSGFIDFSISEVKDDDEITLYNTYTGESFTPGKVNRFLLMPLYIGVQKRLFKDEILDNFRPYITAAAGPTMIYVFPYNLEYFNAIGKGQPKYTVGGYVGLGAFIGSEQSSIFGLNFRYYFVPYTSGLESMRSVVKKEFGGFYVTLSFGSAW
jgi:hypothetical protein